MNSAKVEKTLHDPKRMGRMFLRLIPLYIAVKVSAAAAGAPGYADVAPIFQQRCVVCHSGENAPKGLRLDSYGNILKGSRMRPVIVPGAPKNSELVRRIKGISQPRMPLTGPPYLTDRQISLIEEWISAGASSGITGGGREPVSGRYDQPLLPMSGVNYGNVESIFRDHCIICHSGEGPPLGLRLDSYKNVIRGSERGTVVVPGSPRRSELVRRIKGISQPRMPLTGPPYLSDEQISSIERWVKEGAREGIGPGKTGEGDTTPEKLGPGPGEAVTYSHVAPIFLKRCVKCHAEKGQMGGPPEGLILKTREQILAGGERAVVIPENPAASLIVRHITGREAPRMPFDGPPYLSEEEIRLISDWISQGAPDDQGRKAPIPAGARVRLEGILTGYWEVDGTPLTLAPGVRIKKKPSPGDPVEVRGTLLPDGSIRAERIRRR